MFSVFRKFALTSLATFGAVVNSYAAVPAIVGTSVTSITADANDMFTAFFPLVVAVFGLMLTVKLFKRFGSKV